MLFIAHRRIFSVSRQDFYVVAEDGNQRIERFSQRASVAAFEVGAPDASLEQGIAREANVVFGDIETDAAGGMSGGVDRSDLERAEREFGRLRQIGCSLWHGGDRYAEHFAHIGNVFDDDIFVGMISDIAYGDDVGEGFRAGDVIDMRVRQQHIIEIVGMVADAFGDGLGFAAWVDDSGFARFFTYNYICIDAEFADAIANDFVIFCFEFVFIMEHKSILRLNGEQLRERPIIDGHVASASQPRAAPVVAAPV